MSEPQFEWYTYQAIESRNALISMVAGPPSIGKTYGKKLESVADGIKTGRQVMWIRRSLTELNPAKDGFFDSIAKLWPGFEFRTEGNSGQVRMDGEKWVTIIRFAALSVAYQWKGTEFPEVDDIIYDECFAPPGGKYLLDELEKLRRLWITVNRDRVGSDGRAKTRLWMMGNPIELDNPYFLAWGFDASREWQWAKGAKGDVIMHLVDADKYVRRVTETIYGKAIGTAQLDYAGGEYMRPDGGYVIEKRPPNSKPFCTLVTLDGTFGIWEAPDFVTMYVTPGALADPNAPVVAFEKLAVRPGVPWSDGNTYIRREVQRHYRRGSMFMVTTAAMAARTAIAR